MDAGIDKSMESQAIAVVGLAVIVIMGIAILTQFKSSGLVSNETVDSFITGLAIFGTFIGILILGVITKVVINLIRQK